MGVPQRPIIINALFPSRSAVNIGIAPKVSPLDVSSFSQNTSSGYEETRPNHQLIGLSPSYTVKTNPCFRYEGKTGKMRNLVIFKDNPMNNHINGELSTRPFD